MKKRKSKICILCNQIHLNINKYDLCKQIITGYGYYKDGELQISIKGLNKYQKIYGRNN